MIRRPPRSTPLYSSAASDVYKRQTLDWLQGAFDVDQWLQEERDMSLSTPNMSFCELISPPASQIPCCTIPAPLTASTLSSTPRGMMAPTKPQQQHLRPSSPGRVEEPSTPIGAQSSQPRTAAVQHRVSDSGDPDHTRPLPVAASLERHRKPPASPCFQVGSASGFSLLADSANPDSQWYWLGGSAAAV